MESHRNCRSLAWGGLHLDSPSLTLDRGMHHGEPDPCTALQAPAFRVDEQAKTLTIWLGYFDEVYGEYKGRYMVPPLRLVPPGTALDLEMTAPALSQKLLEQILAPQVHARVATIELPHSRTRGQQPLEDYIQSSCAIRSAPAEGK